MPRLSKNMAVRILTTGGTIDGLEYASGKDAPKNKKPLVPGLLKQARIPPDCRIEEVCFKDSRFFDDKDLELLLDKCKKCREQKIVITHGTRTMTDTARYLGGRKLPKTIVLTGSMILGDEKNSDALFNLGAALTAAQLLPPNVYIAMNGKIFLWDNVRKNTNAGCFEALKE